MLLSYDREKYKQGRRVKLFESLHLDNSEVRRFRKKKIIAQNCLIYLEKLLGGFQKRWNRGFLT